MALKIVHYNAPVLNKKGAKITVFDAALRKLAAEMVDAMHEAGGIGLAAQQIGKALQLCVVDLRDADAEFTWSLDGRKPPLDICMPMVLANPVVTIVPGTPETLYEEGCLSFPEIRGKIARQDNIVVKFQDEHGTAHSMSCDGLLARCVQHEVDHLNGVLFIERMDKKVRSSIDDAVKTLAKETREAGKPPPKPPAP